MAFQARNLSVLAYANGFTLWHYTTPDDGETVLRDGYFDAAEEMLRVGDMLLVNADTDGDGGGALLVVRRNHGGTVALAPMANT